MTLIYLILAFILSVLFDSALVGFLVAFFVQVFILNGYIKS